MKKIFRVSNFVQKWLLFIAILFFAVADSSHIHIGNNFENMVYVLGKIIGVMLPVWFVIFLLNSKKSLSVFWRTSFSKATLSFSAVLIGITSFINPYQGSKEGFWALGHIVKIVLLLYVINVIYNLIEAIWQNKNMRKVFLIIFSVILVSILSSLVTAGVLAHNDKQQTISSDTVITPTTDYRKYFPVKNDTQAQQDTATDVSSVTSTQNSALDNLIKQQDMRNYIDMKNDELQQNIRLEQENQRTHEAIWGN